MDIKDGIINLDTPEAGGLGFTPDKFNGYLWKEGDSIIISFIVSLQPGRGNLSKLFEQIHSLGYTIKVPTPFKRMRAILRHKGFKKVEEWDEFYKENITLWVKEPEKAGGILAKPDAGETPTD